MTQQYAADLNEEAFFLERADSLCTNFHSNFLAINNKGFFLEVWFPDFLSVALREGHIVAVLFAFTGNIAFVHSHYCICFSLRGQVATSRSVLSVIL